MNIIESWSLGYVSFVLLFAFPILYILFRQVRRFGAWTHRDESPKERKIVYVPTLAVFGFILGGLIQQYVDIAVQCHSNNEKMLACWNR